MREASTVEMVLYSLGLLTCVVLEGIYLPAYWRSRHRWPITGRHIALSLSHRWMVLFFGVVALGRVFPTKVPCGVHLLCLVLGSWCGSGTDFLRATHTYWHFVLQNDMLELRRANAEANERSRTPTVRNLDADETLDAEETPNKTVTPQLRAPRSSVILGTRQNRDATLTKLWYGGAVIICLIHFVLYAVYPDYALDLVGENNCSVGVLNIHIIFFLFALGVAPFIGVIMSRLDSVNESFGLKTEFDRLGKIVGFMCITNALAFIPQVYSWAWDNFMFFDLSIMISCALATLILIRAPVMEADKEAERASSVGKLKSSVGRKSIDESDSLAVVLQNPEKRERFRQFLATEWAVENICFLDEVEEFRELCALKGPGSSKVQSKARSIFKEYIDRANAQLLINLPSAHFTALDTVFLHASNTNIEEVEEIDPEVFDAAYKDICVMLEDDNFQRFLTLNA